jgi:hypothetical protein
MRARKAGIDLKGTLEKLFRLGLSPLLSANDAQQVPGVHVIGRRLEK